MITLLAMTVMLAPGPAAQAPQSRVKAIWEAAEDRIVRQNDVWFKAGDFPRAIQSLRVLHALEPHDYEIATDLGWMFENVERWDEALATYKSYRQQNAGEPDGALPEAQYYFMKRRYSEIPPILEPAMKMGKPAHPNSYRILAHAYDRLKKYADAKRIWTQYLKLHPSDETAKANLKRVEGKLGGK